MLLTETIRVALNALRVNKVRSLLTMLGIVIGVGSVITMVALGTGAQRKVQDQIARLGTTIIQINPQSTRVAGVSTGTPVKFTTKDVAMIRERATSVVGVNYQQDKRIQVVWRTQNANVQVTGTNSNFLEVRNFKLALGRMFNDDDDLARRRVAVIGAAVLPMLGSLDGSDMLGERIRIGGEAFIVIGVLANRGVVGVGDADDQILIPFQTSRYRIFGNDQIQDIWARAVTEDSLVDAMAQIQVALRRSQKLRAGRPDNFTMRTQSDFLVALNESAQVFTLLLAGVAAVSLLVGGIGIMNIMLVSVTERTREIGVRKALGATRFNILAQFLTEAVVLCLLGGSIGISAGLGASSVLHRWMAWDTAVDGASIALAFGIASGIGLLFGVWPARRASGLAPVEALRHE